MTQAQPAPVPIESMMPLSPLMYGLGCALAYRAGQSDPLSHCIGAVIQAGAALEAFLNEEIAYVVAAKPQWKGPLEALDRLETDSRWLLVPLLTMQRTFDRGSEPFQSFRALVRLRNALVHYRTNFSASDDPPSFARELETRFEFTKPEPPPPPWQHMQVRLAWQHRILNAACARWACTVARSMVLEWFELARNPRDKAYNAWIWSLAYLDGKDRGEPPADVLSVPVQPGVVGIVDLSTMTQVSPASGEKPPEGT